MEVLQAPKRNAAEQQEGGGRAAGRNTDLNKGGQREKEKPSRKGKRKNSGQAESDRTQMNKRLHGVGRGLCSQTSTKARGGKEKTISEERDGGTLPVKPEREENDQ